MGRFRYRMQNILNIKEKLEVQAKNEFAAASMELAQEQEVLAQMLAHNKELEEESRRLRLKESLSIKDIEDNTLSKEIQKDKMKQQALRIHAAERKVEQKKKVMVDLMKERKTHEILKERAFEQFLLDEKAEESKQIDQLTSYTYGRD
ncbi:MAG: flagellar FliJ family protein [Lachnospiraceae bacterium]|nr:flagellar FliJ family protein [Lachnospiraceae bacterium]